MALTINRNGQLIQVNTGESNVMRSVFPLIREDEGWSEVEIEIGAEDEKASSSLPLLATASDVREIVKFLRKKPGGVTLVEAIDAIKKPTLDPRKMTAYEYWGLIARQGDRIRLSQRGWDFAHKLEPETQAFRELLRNTDLYYAALIWLRETEAELVTDSDLAEYWQRHHSTKLETTNEKIVKANVACFFHLCQAAEFGNLTIGKRGQPTRLRVDQDELKYYLALCSNETEASQNVTVSEPQPLASRQVIKLPVTNSMPATQANRPRVFISCAEGINTATQISAILELAEIQTEVYERKVSFSPLLSNEVLNAMRACDAAIVFITPNDGSESQDGEVALNQSVLHQINAALALYGEQVTLIYTDGLKPTGELQAITHFVFDEGELSLEKGVEIAKVVKSFSLSRNQ
ncbi:MAG TPA: TIR domain-containing protein [Blastocatellia bacterium]|nr:TIR domain-containing protein [Blastocatellia bacterium]